MTKRRKIINILNLLIVIFYIAALGAIGSYECELISFKRCVETVALNMGMMAINYIITLHI